MNQTIQFETITPDVAKQLLEKNTCNRSVNEDNLNSIIADMKKGNFHLTGESIKIAKDGTLLDGQHRLMALVKAGITIKIPVVRGLENDAFKWMDIGRKRQASDVLQIEGYKNATRIAAMSKFIINFKRNKFFTVAGSQNRSSHRITNNDISEFCLKHSETLYESYPYGFNKFNKLLPGVTLASMHFILRGIDEGMADDFCHKISNGHDIASDSPIYLLRQMLTADLRSRKKSPAIYRLAIICKAWNIYRSKKKVQILKWDSIKEPFPKPI